MRFPEGGVLCLILTLGLAGCVAPAAPPGPLAPPVVVAPAVVPQPVPPPLPPAPPSPDELLGLSGEAVVLKLGLPAFRHPEPPAEVWRYRGADCLFYVFLVDEGDIGESRVSHVDARSGNGEASDRAVCYEALLKRVDNQSGAGVLSR